MDLCGFAIVAGEGNRRKAKILLDGVALVERSADLSRGRLRGRNTSEAEDTVEESVGRHCGWQLDVCLRGDLTAVARKRRELESKAKR